MNVEPGRPRRRFSLGVRDPAPLEDTSTFWRVMAQAATIGMFVLAVGAFLYFSRPLLLPVLAAVTVGMTVGPVASWLERRRVPSWVTALATCLLLIAVINVAILSLSAPFTELVKRAPEIGDALRTKFQVLERPIAVLRDLQESVPGGTDTQTVVVASKPTDLLGSAVTLLTPAVLQFLLFFVTLFFFVLNRADFRQYLVIFFGTREGRLRALKVLNDIEYNLSSYLLTVTMINIGLGVAIAAGMWMLGVPGPLLWGALAFGLNYVPYIGPAILQVLVLGIGLVTFPTLTGALLPLAFTLAVVIVEGQFITPNIIGRKLELSPLVVFLTVAFWTWLWGPIGAFLAMPIVIAALVTMNHLYPDTKDALPG